MKSTSFLIELDYNADPDDKPSDVRTRLHDEIDVMEGYRAINDGLIVVRNLGDALKLKLNFASHILSINRMQHV